MNLGPNKYLYAVINIGLERLPPRQWPKDGRRVVKVAIFFKKEFLNFQKAFGTVNYNILIDLNSTTMV